MNKFNNSPKQGNTESLYAQNDWYSFYAGYSDRFVTECIEKNANDSNSSGYRIMDPWNGTGTTTLCSAIQGVDSIGVDINPVMFVIAKAKLFNTNSISYQEWMLRVNNDNNGRAHITYSDPLCQWFTKKTVRNLRTLENRLCRDRIDNNNGKARFLKDNIETISDETAYVALCFFIILRNHSKILHSSNPTWIKNKTKELISIDYNDLVREFSDLINRHKKITYKTLKKAPELFISLSQKIPIEDEYIDLVITSPPYCTRIDYAIYTQLELAFLGYDKEYMRQLRKNMIGSPTIHPKAQNTVLEQFQYINKLLKQIKEHDSKAAESYYYKTYKQYFVEMYDSVLEIKRCLKKEGIAFLVIQDSWFKDILIDVPKAIIEIAEVLGMKAKREDCSVKNNMAYINTKSRGYQEDKKAVESVVIITK